MLSLWEKHSLTSVVYMSRSLKCARTNSHDHILQWTWKKKPTRLISFCLTGLSWLLPSDHHHHHTTTRQACQDETTTTTSTWHQHFFLLVCSFFILFHSFTNVYIHHERARKRPKRRFTVVWVTSLSLAPPPMAPQPVTTSPHLCNVQHHHNI